jgi:hypothetical protein
MRARWVTMRARWVTMRARWVTMRARWVTMRARWVTMRARWVTFTGERAPAPGQHDGEFGFRSPLAGGKRSYGLVQGTLTPDGGYTAATGAAARRQVIPFAL